MKKHIAAFLLLCVVILVQARLPICAETPFGHVYCRNAREPKRIALTFDDGPHPRYTLEILKILMEYEIRATFFMIGVNAEQYPQTLQKVVESGCEIANHTYSHRRIDRLNKQDMQEEILRCEEVLYSLTGIRPHLFRPPEGMISQMAKETMQGMNYDVVLWSIDTLDWAHTPSSTIVQSVKSHLKGGDIILMHDYVSGKNTTCDSLRILIPQLLAQGYEFVTVSELIEGETA